MAKLITDKNKLKLGDCTCVVRDKYTGKTRLAEGSVAKFPYKKTATKETRKKYGKHLIYVIHGSGEEVVGYYQDSKAGVKRGKRKTTKV